MKIFLAHSGREQPVAEQLAAVLASAGHDVIQPFAEPWSQQNVSELSRFVRSADLVVAILSDRRANVLYELGLAVGAGRPVVIAAPGPYDVPADVSSAPFAILTGNPREDANEIARRVETIGAPTGPVRTLTGTTEENLRTVAQDPSALGSLAPGDLERLLAAFLDARDFDVRPPSERDLGYDFAVSAPGSDALMLVQVKAYREHSRVSVEAVRRLAETVQSSGAAGGLMISTSAYSPAAMAFAAANTVVLMTLDEVLDAQPNDALLRLSTELRREGSGLQNQDRALGSGTGLDPAGHDPRGETPPALLAGTREAAQDIVQTLGGGRGIAELIADSVASYVDLSWQDPAFAALASQEGEWRRYIRQLAVRLWLLSLRESPRFRPRSSQRAEGAVAEEARGRIALDSRRLDGVRAVMVNALVSRQFPRQDAEDVAQDAIERILADPGPFTERLHNLEANKGYFTMMALNSYLRKLRSEQRRRERERRVAPSAVEGDLVANVGLVRPGFDLDRVAEEAGLTQRQQEYLRAVLGRNLSVEDIATSSGTSSQAVRAVLARAVNRLRQHLAS